MSRPAVEIRNVFKEYVDARTQQPVRAVDDVSLDIKEGEFFALLGPSGCGKTTTLRMIAGFEEPTAGEVLLRGESMRGIPAFHRPVNTVFQDYALFPHMTVLQNVMFGLKMAKVPQADARRRAEEALEMVRLPHVGSRKPRALSGGQRQRVALARALVNRPFVLLLDEPLGALDLKLRRAMQFELKQLQQEVGITFIYVTHDQEEALTMADRIAVMNEGEVLQVGRADEIYERPVDRFVADFIGETNFIDGALRAKRGNVGQLELKGGRMLEGILRDPEVEVGGAATLAVRPEKIELAPIAGGAVSEQEALTVSAPLVEGSSEAPITEIRGTVAGVHYLGTDARYHVSVDGLTLVVRVQNQHHGYASMLGAGTPVKLRWRTEYGSLLS